LFFLLETQLGSYWSTGPWTVQSWCNYFPHYCPLWDTTCSTQLCWRSSVRCLSFHLSFRNSLLLWFVA